MPSHAPRRWRSPGSILGAVMVVLAIGAYVLSELVSTSGPDLASSVWAVEVEGEARIVFLTRLEKSTISRFPTRSLPGSQSTDVVEYHLVMARAADGIRR